jgi:hypothetical protein
MSTARDIQKNLTRPTSVTVMLVLFQIFKKIWPEAMDTDWQEITYSGIGIIGATGIIDKAWRNRKEIKMFIKNLFKRKEKRNGKSDESIK